MGVPGAEMVNFLNTEDYFFGLPEETASLGSEQGGIFLRSFITLRFEDVPNEKIQAMHEFFTDLKERANLEKKRDAKYTMVNDYLANESLFQSKL